MKDNEDYEAELAALPDEEEETQTAENRLVYLPITELYPHPDNPRKDLGDLAELAESIKVKGVMQNLTVVKGHYLTLEQYIAMSKAEGVTKEVAKNMYSRENAYVNDGYTIIIGHRRAGASKLAGLTELPCVITEMSEQEQIGTMLLENMQRSDLTMYEQAQAFQMMIDFGESLDSIAEKTGFSKTTVRRRIKLAELDGDKLKKASSRQITLEDLDRLSKIEDIDKRNELLDIIGTSNFEWQYKQAITRQEEEKNCELWRSVLLEKGLTEIAYNDVFGNDKYRNSARPYATCSSVAPSEFVIDEDMQFFGFNRGTVYFRRERNAEDEEKMAAYQREQEKERERKDALRDITKRAYELRKEFVESISEATAKKLAPVVIEYNIQKDWSDVDNYGWNSGYIRSNFPDQLPEEHGINAIYQQIKDTPFRSLLLHTYIRWCDNAICGYLNYNGDWVENKRLDYIYSFLEKLGYEVSDEERSMMSGTHDLFGGEEEDEDVDDAVDEGETVEAELIEDEDPTDKEMPKSEKDVFEQLKEMYGADE